MSTFVVVGGVRCKDPGVRDEFTWALVEGDEEIVGKRLRLRGVRVEDCTEGYAAWLNDPEVNRFLEVGREREDVESVTAYVRAVVASPSASLLAIIDAEDGRHIGNVKVAPVDEAHRSAHVSYFLGDRRAWGRGIASEAVALVVAASFERLGMRRLEAGVHAENGASRRVLERAGFELEGRLREKLWVGDHWDDQLLYGLLVERWGGAGLS